MWEPDDQTLSMMMIDLFIVPIIVSFSGGALAGIITLMIIRKTKFYIEIFRLLIGAIAGYEAVVIYFIFIFKFEDENSRKNLNEIFKEIIYAHDFSHIDSNLKVFIIPFILGAIGASIGIFLTRKVCRWRSHN